MSIAGIIFFESSIDIVTFVKLKSKDSKKSQFSTIFTLKNGVIVEKKVEWGREPHSEYLSLKLEYC